MTILFRVQGPDGRGPFAPGLSDEWLDDDIGDRAMLPSWIEEFGMQTIEQCQPGESSGCACRTIEGLCQWFSPTEREKLAAMGFKVVSFSDARIIAESPNQVVFGRMRPLAVGVQVRRWP